VNTPRFLSLLAALLLAILPLLASATPLPMAPASAQTPIRAPNWYDVELIVFSNTDPGAGSLESWPVNPGIPDWDSAVPINPTGSGVPYMQLPASGFRLASAWQKLARSSDYQPLLQLAWIQPAIERTSALFVRIGTPPMAASSVAGTTPAPAAATVTVSGTPVYGTARLSTTGPYLHFDLDLVYRGPPAKMRIPDDSPGAANGNAVPQFQWYRLRQDRRIDAGKLNYFDNPLFGVLLLVTPSKPQ
jgi:Peptidoglycan-binding protein, CsiV